MFKTLYAKLAFGLVILLMTIGVIYTLLSATIAFQYQQEVNQQINHDLARNLVADRNLVAEGALDQQALKETFHQYMVINPSIEIYLLDLSGNILSYSADPGKVKRNRVSLEPIYAFLRMEQPFPLLGDDPRSHDRQKAFSATPVPSTENPEGYLYVVLRGEKFDSVEQIIKESLFFKLSGWAVAASLAVGLLAGLLIFRLLTRRLHRLSSLMGKFQSSNFKSTGRYLEGDSNQLDEIDRLGFTFDQMAQRLREQLGQLTNQDNLRRQLVAQVSHDLRTPLASMIGYIESLQMKGDNLSSEDRDIFVQTALSQGRRLDKLISELFELASLDACERQPDLESFAPAELVFDIVQKHRIRGQYQGVNLHFEPPDGLPFTLGDISMTERILDNLIENAMRYTPKDGEIRVELGECGDYLTFSVSDSGPGVAEDDLDSLFEPFYQADSNIYRNQNAGLGLAITKRLVALQKGSIQVENRAPQGAVFRFTLPIA